MKVKLSDKVVMIGLGYVMDYAIIILWIAVVVVGVIWYFNSKKKSGGGKIGGQNNGKIGSGRKQ